MRKLRIFLLIVSLLGVCNLFACSSGSKSVNLTLDNYQDYLDVKVSTSNYSKKLFVQITSRNSDYIFENCEVELKPVMWSSGRYDSSPQGDIYLKNTIIIKIERNGKANYTDEIRDGYQKVTGSDGKNYIVEMYSSYTIVSVKGKVAKNPLS